MRYEHREPEDRPWTNTDHERAATLLKNCRAQIVDVVRFLRSETPAYTFLADAMASINDAMHALDREHAALRVSPYAPRYPGEEAQQ